MSLIEGTNVTVGHLGIVAGMFDKIGIGEYIDQVMPKTRHHNVSHGIAVKALTLNGLGFTERRLYVMPEFFEDIAVERLLGKSIKPEHLNEYLERLSISYPSKSSANGYPQMAISGSANGYLF